MTSLNHTLFLPSDILHLKATPSINTNDAAASNRNQPRHLVICHKDDQTLYKATRKIGRTAKRLLAPFITNSEQKYAGKYYCETVYWIKGGKSEDAIQKRFVNELGSCVDLQFQLKHLAVATNGVDIEPKDDTTAHVIKKFSAKTNGDDSSCNLSVVFVDLDNLIQISCYGSTQHQFTNNDHRVYWECAEKILTSLLSQIQYNSDNHPLILHVKCTRLYRSTSDIIVLPSDVTTAKNQYVTKRDIDAHLNRKSTSNCNYHDDQTTKNVIRRLRETKGAAQCPLSKHPIRYIISKPKSENDTTITLVEICRFYNYDSERGCLRSKRARNNPNVKGCDMDHEHCHLCGVFGHCALECLNHTRQVNGESSSLEPMVFSNTSNDGDVVLQPLSEYQQQNRNDDAITHKLPALVVLGGRLRGRTLASCEMLPLSSDQNAVAGQWIQMPNLLEHRGSHAACSPDGAGLVFAMGGGGVDGNLDTVESYRFDERSARVSVGRWQVLNGRLSCPRHAFGSVACMNNDKTVNLFAVGGWKYGSVSCESVDKLTFGSSCGDFVSRQWDACAPLLKPRRLHSVVASADGSSIYVFGGYVDDRSTTPSIEKYDVASNQWTHCDELPFGDQSCPLVQVISDWSRADISFLIFPFGSEKSRSPDNAIEVLRYTPNSDRPFSSVVVPSGKNELENQKLYMPQNNWASFSAACWKSQKKAYLVGGTLDGKWTACTYELDLQTMKWNELPEMLCARRRSVALVVDSFNFNYPT